jgi:hypothetical protein
MRFLQVLPASFLLFSFVTGSTTLEEDASKFAAKQRRMPGNDMNELDKENAKNKALMRECINYCQPRKVDGYKFTPLINCKSATNLIVYGGSKYYCAGESIVAGLELYTVMKNRFGEERSEVSSCTWATHNYEISGDCSESSLRGVKTKKQDSEIIYPPNIKELFPNHKFP